MSNMLCRTMRRCWTMQSGLSWLKRLCGCSSCSTSQVTCVLHATRPLWRTHTIRMTVVEHIRSNDNSKTWGQAHEMAEAFATDEERKQFWSEFGGVQSKNERHDVKIGSGEACNGSSSSRAARSAGGHKMNRTASGNFETSSDVSSDELCQVPSFSTLPVFFYTFYRLAIV